MIEVSLGITLVMEKEKATHVICIFTYLPGTVLIIS